VLVFSVFGLAGIATLLADKNTELAATSRALGAKNRELLAKNQELDQQRQRAAEREELAIDVLKKYHDTVTTSAELRFNSKLDALRKARLKEPLELFRRLRDQLQAGRGTRPETLAKLAEASFDSYHESLAIWERLARDHPADTRYQRGLANSLNDIGSVHWETGHRAEALESFRQALAIRERLAHDHPDVTDCQSDLALSLEDIGIVLWETGRKAEALESARRAVAIFERLARDNPTVARYQDKVAGIHCNIGTVLWGMGHKAEGLESVRRAVAIRERLTRDHPDVTDYQGWLGSTWNNLAEVEMEQGRWLEARQSLERAIESQRRALSSAPHNPLYRWWLTVHLAHLVKVHRALSQPTEAVRTARECAAALVQENHAALYQVARALALSVPLVQENQKPALAAEAVQMLNAAVNAGWSDAEHTSRDPDLVPLHDRDDFRRLVAELFDRGFPADPFAR
jgi:tetratricopeptide (TPR) repeat protein